jgi:hypothetical protein
LTTKHVATVPVTDEMLADALALKPRVYVPAAVGIEPRTAWDALRSARALLAEEGRWARFCYFASSHEATPDDPYCGSWSACAVGALQLVTMGVQYQQGWGKWRPLEDDYVPPFDVVTPEERRRYAIYTEALALLDTAAEVCAGGKGAAGAISFNDTWATNLHDVLDMYDVAIAQAAA